MISKNRLLIFQQTVESVHGLPTFPAEHHCLIFLVFKELILRFEPGMLSSD